MNKKDRAIVRKTLTACLPHLWDGKSGLCNKRTYICFAINDGAKDLNARDITRAVIWERIHPYNTVIGWVQNQGIKTGGSARKQQAYRKAWVESMIEEFSN